jgi:hypothetical protein
MPLFGLACLGVFNLITTTWIPHSMRRQPARASILDHPVILLYSQLIALETESSPEGARISIYRTPH